jgi:DNA-binding MarR family transcriptional regulator
MSQDGIDLETSLGYLLKEASSTLRAAMESVLRPLGMTVTHYSCLELLAQRPGLSNSELARGAFVTRQSMNVLLQALERDGYVTRPAEARMGRVLPAQLTPLGRRNLEQATAAVRSVEIRMLAGMTKDEQSGAFRILTSMIHSLRDDSERRSQPAPPAQQRFWINTVSLDHAEAAAEGGFTQADHGAKTRLSQPQPGDEMVFYSPRTSLRGGRPVQQFTALATIIGEEPYQAIVSDEFRPWRLAATFHPCTRVDAKRLVDQLSFITDATHWGLPFRRGLFTIPREDFLTISAHMAGRNTRIGWDRHGRDDEGESPSVASE